MARKNELVIFELVNELHSYVLQRLDREAGLSRRDVAAVCRRVAATLNSGADLLETVRPRTRKAGTP